MPASPRRPEPAAAIKLGVGTGEPSEEREQLAARRRTAPSLRPPAAPGAAPAPPPAPFAWVLTGVIEDVLVGPDWAW